MMPGRVLVVASYNRDTVVEVPRMPEAGETLSGGRIAFHHGGKGSNQAIQAARCGSQVRIVAALGDDGAGIEAQRLWMAEGIDTGGSRHVQGERTGCALVLVEAGGENRIVVDAGANARLDASLVLEANAAGCAVALATLEVPTAAVQRAFEQVRRHGGLAVLNAAPMDTAALARLAPFVDILVLNEGEALALSQRREASQGLGALGLELLEGRWASRAVVITAGGKGAWYAQDGQTGYRRAHAVQVVDTTGAGDAFVGSLCAKLAEGTPLGEAMPYAVAAGALACTRAGAEPSLAPSAQIEALAKGS